MEAIERDCRESRLPGSLNYCNLTATRKNKVQTVHQNVAFSYIFSRIILYVPPRTQSKNPNCELRIRRLWVRIPPGAPIYGDLTPCSPHI